MYIVVVPLQIKEGHKDAFVEALLDDARGSVNNEPGCLRFDVVQDGADPNRIWLYEVYKDEAAFQSHLQAPYFAKFQDAAKDFLEKGPPGAGQGSYNIWPPDDEWK
jgi:autoinducer 2-degrading protein